MQAIIEVFAEAAGAHELDQIAVRGGDQAEIDFHGFARADGVDLAVLQRAQQLHLRVHRQFADLVEEQGAAIGLDELADLFLAGAGEGALLVAEQDRLHEHSPGSRRN